MTGSTSDPSVPRGSRRRLAVGLAGAASLVAALTALVFLIRAGGDPTDAATWPITWELGSSDNGTLFQFWADVAAGRELDWSFSPQVFVFPELPMSGLGFALAAGDLYRYYLVVAVLNQVALFLLLAALARAAWPRAGAAAVVLRASAGILPLLLLPLVGTTWVLSFHLAPTYYVGMYLALLAAPLVLLARSRFVRVLLAAGLALTIASNPLTLVFLGPGVVAVAVVSVVRAGWRPLGRPALVVGAVLAAAALLRIAVTPLQGTSLFTYMDVDVFRARVAALGPYWSFQLRDPATHVLLTFGAALAVACLVAAARSWWRLADPAWGDPDAARRALATVALGVVPLGGLAATGVALITHQYYFWPVLVLPFALVPFALPARTLPGVVAAGSVALLVVGAATGGLPQLADSARYFGDRSPETRCLDAAVPGQTGFATFSDARRVGLPSATGIRFIPVTADLAPNLWLTNRAYARLESGTFLYVNERGDERALDGDRMRARFGEPDRVVECADGQRVWVYADPVSVSGG